ncbi:ATP-binding cassette domain-containing protein [Streptococcus pneumoniae]|uniref:ATP-binding cassette domain-containing protein n=1 Tax=Streptococcus pneumoniae TaxID=1313 RepID=UPI0005E4B116|nr:ATP-binding cassette domain-containing protein [Streptococcus pneumoniae]CTO92957.1 siderophore uptake ATP-binding protein [Streptococcus pneumoniae]
MKLENIDKSIQKQDILQGISLEVSPQKLTAFIGPNGAGKSTLLSIMSRLTKKDQGVLSIKGREIESWNSQELAQELTILKQKINYQAKLTVEELVSFGRFPYSRGRLRSEDWEKIRETLNYLELTNLKDRYINSLSGGQLQRVFIAMVLAQDTDFILLDEPLNNLDINIASQYADEIVAFKDGQVFSKGRTDQIMQADLLSQLYEIPITLADINDKKICIYS